MLFSSNSNTGMRSIRKACALFVLCCVAILRICAQFIFKIRDSFRKSWKNVSPFDLEFRGYLKNLCLICASLSHHFQNFCSIYFRSDSFGTVSEHNMAIYELCVQFLFFFSFICNLLFHFELVFQDRSGGRDEDGIAWNSRNRRLITYVLCPRNPETGSSRSQSSIFKTVFSQLLM